MSPEPQVYLDLPSKEIVQTTYPATYFWVWRNLPEWKRPRADGRGQPAKSLRYSSLDFNSALFYHRQQRLFGWS